MRYFVGFRVCYFFSSRRRHTMYWRDWSSDVCSSDLAGVGGRQAGVLERVHQRAQRLAVVDPAEELPDGAEVVDVVDQRGDRKSTRLNYSHANISYAGFWLKKKK